VRAQGIDPQALYRRGEKQLITATCFIQPDLWGGGATQLSLVVAIDLAYYRTVLKDRGW
jgi:hypothetical protein